MNSKSGIYAITNIVNGHRYIGSSMRISKRWCAHRSYLRRGMHDNEHLQRAWNRYGEDAFRFEIMEECAPEMLFDVEQQFLGEFEPEYNIAQVAGTCLGVRHLFSAEHKAKIGMANTGKKRTPEQRAAQSVAHMGNRNALGYKHTPKALAKMSAAKKDKPWTRARRLAQNARSVGGAE